LPCGIPFRWEQVVDMYVIKEVWHMKLNIISVHIGRQKYEGWNFNSDNYLFTTDTK